MTNPPTFVDDFSTGKSDWGDIQKNDDVYPLSDDIVDGRLNLSMAPEESTNYTWPINGLLNAEEFIIDFDFEFVQKSWQPNNVVFGYKFLKIDGEDSEYNLKLVADGTWEIVANKVGGNGYEVADAGTYSTVGTQKVLLSVFDQNKILFMINNQPVALIEGIAKNGNSNYFYFSSHDGRAEINFDNIQFWNLEGVESLQ